MKTIKNIDKITLMILAVLSMTACEYKDLDDDIYPEDWTKQSVALTWDYTKVDSIPGSFRVAFYPADSITKSKVTDGFILFDVYNNRAILRDIPFGNYNITAWNTDTEHNIVSGLNDRNSLNATTTTFYASGKNPENVLDSLYCGQSIYDTPDYMVHANKEYFTVIPDEQYQPLQLAPDSMVVAIDYKIHGIAALHLASQIRAAVNNVTKKRLISKSLETKDTCVVMSDCMRSIADSLLYGRFFVYGMEPEDFQLMDHTMTLFFWMENANVFFPIKINEFLRPYRKEDNIIYLDIPDIGLDLRKYTSSGTFVIDVNDWQNIEEDISW